jgi:hypothetical protein
MLATIVEAEGNECVNALGVVIREGATAVRNMYDEAQTTARERVSRPAFQASLK